MDALSGRKRKDSKLVAVCFFGTPFVSSSSSFSSPYPGPLGGVREGRRRGNYSRNVLLLPPKKRVRCLVYVMMLLELRFRCLIKDSSEEAVSNNCAE